MMVPIGMWRWCAVTALTGENGDTGRQTVATLSRC